MRRATHDAVVHVTYLLVLLLVVLLVLDKHVKCVLPHFDVIQHGRCTPRPRYGHSRLAVLATKVRAIHSDLVAGNTPDMFAARNAQV